MGGLMLVDPDILHAFATQVEQAAGTIRRADVGRHVTTAADQLDGSTTQWAARLVGAHVTAGVNDIAKSVDEMGVAVHGAGNTYRVTDTDLADNLAKIF
jgi:hypothetical protein